MSVVHKLKISNRAPGRASDGRNTRIDLDGVLLKGVTFISVTITPRGLAKISMEMIADLDIELNPLKESVEIKKK